MLDSTPPNVNLILLRHDNHANVSGYDRISEYIHHRPFHHAVNPSFVQRVVSALLRPLLTRSDMQWYRKASLITETQAALRWLVTSGEVFHFVYGENSYRYLGWLNRLRSNHVVCTYHTPPNRFREVVRNQHHLAGIDAVIVVSRVCLDFFEKVLGPDRVHFVPHGVDTDFFTPAVDKKPNADRLQCVFVGSHLRDFEVLSRVARDFADTDANIHFNVVTAEANFRYFDGLTNVACMAGLSDEQLRGVYQQADIFTMPLTDCTANNSLLEAMACGLPIMVSDLPGVRDYVDETTAILVPVGDDQQFGQRLRELISDQALRERLAKMSRASALEFSFPKVARMTQDVYRHVTGQLSTTTDNSAQS